MRRRSVTPKRCGNLGCVLTGGNFRLFRKYVDEIWHLPTGHFNPDAARVARVNTLQRPIPIADVLVEGSSYSRTKLKQRLYDTGLKTRNCELCGQGENWKGRRMSLILDHINGVPDDNRLENLRIVCPNCAATLWTLIAVDRIACRRRNLSRCARQNVRPTVTPGTAIARSNCGATSRESKPRRRSQRPAKSPAPPTSS